MKGKKKVCSGMTTVVAGNAPNSIDKNNIPILASGNRTDGQNFSFIGVSLLFSGEK